MFFNKLKHIEKKRLKLYQNNNFDHVLEPIFKHKLPLANTSLSQLKLVSIDFETSGLNFEQDHILSIGGVCLSKLEIDFQSSFHHYVKYLGKLNNDTAVINQITLAQLLDGIELEQAMTILLDKIQGAVIISHCHTIEKNFLLRALNLKLSTFLPIIFLDTMLLEKTIMRHDNYNLDVSLSACRKRYNLPPYNAHNALADSVATAELFLAQLKTIYKNQDIDLYTLYKRIY